MPVWICRACAVEHPDTSEPPVLCRICSDERQFVPPGGQAWTTLEELATAGTTLSVTEIEPDLFGVTAHPAVGIGQRMHVIRTAMGTVLWDPTGYADPAAAADVLELGPVLAIVASHPHMYGVQVEWSRALGGVPILVAGADREWVQRPDAAIEFFSGEREVAPGLVLRTPGGHFPGSVVAYWAAGAEGRGVLFAGDTLFPGPDGKWVSFMRSYPNDIPLSMAVVDRVATAITAHPFDRIYGNFGNAVLSDARTVVRRSADRQIGWMRGDFDSLT
jgi:glyoxylase-like metal-dependent hydrolase (beta-lactamase superfamily II)